MKRNDAPVPREGDNWIQCDQCSEWDHITCVKATEEQILGDWVCTKCINQSN